MGYDVMIIYELSFMGLYLWLREKYIQDGFIYRG